MIIKLIIIELMFQRKNHKKNKQNNDLNYDINLWY